MMTYENLPHFLAEPNPEVYLGEKYVVVDVETTTHGKGLAIYPENRLVSCAWYIGAGLRDEASRFGWRTDHVYYRRGGEFDHGDLVQLLQSAEFIVGHNLKFDMQWLGRCGLELHTILPYDTLLGEYVLGGNRWRHGRLSLDAISRRRFGTAKIDLIKAMWDVGISTEDIPEEWLRRYCINDVELTVRLFREQRQDLSGLGLLPVLYNRCLLSPVLADIEANGMQLDENLVRSTIATLEPQFQNLEHELARITGGINFNSRQQLADFLYGTLKFEEPQIRRGGEWVPDRTPPSKRHPQGQRKTDVDTISQLKAKTKEQKEFLATYRRYQEVYTELTKYLRKMLECCEKDGGRLYATLNQSSTQTHRLSSTGLAYSMQFQNFPRAYKPLFKARHEGWLVGECDGAQLEFRDAVHLGRDRVGLFDIVNGTDIHHVTATVIWPRVSYDKEYKHPKRQEAKAHTFKPLYGGQSGTSDEKRYYAFFREKYKGIAQWQQRNIDFVLNHKYLETEWGLRYYWPDTTMDRSGYVRNSTSICNYPVQSQATAEIIPMALVFFWHRLKRSNYRMFLVNTVHDSIICELPPEEKDAFHELSRQCLIRDVYYFMRRLYHIDFSVPLGAGVSTGTHWGNKEETVYNAEEELWIEAAREADMI